jgi:hypothetical protein
MNTFIHSLQGLATPPGTAVTATVHDYTLPVPDARQRTLARTWLWLGLFALIGSGVFSILLVLARTPGLNQWIPVADFFRVALVVHVDLSVLVWFAAMAGMLWSLNGSARGGRWSWAALGLCGAGTALMSVGAFIAPGAPIMANYIPVLEGPLFLAGLVIFGAGFSVQVVGSLLSAPRLGGAIDGTRALRFGLNASAVSVGIAMIAFAW